MPPGNILILTDWYEPGYKAGGPIQSCRNFVSAMHESYRLSVLTLDRDLGDTENYPGIQPGEWTHREPGLPVYYATAETLNRRLLADLIEFRNPDFIYLNSMYSYRFSILPLFLLWRKKIRAQIILAPRGMLQQGALKFKPGKKKLFIALLNVLGISRKIHFHATDEQEKRDILRQFPKAGRVEVISNFSGSVPAYSVPVKKMAGELRCVYISRIIPKKNILFFLKMLNLVPERIQLQFTIYGEVEDEKYWLRAQKVIHFLPGNIEVLYRGPLPHAEVIPAMEANHVFVLPTLGENFGHAVFEALSAGRPVLISDQTPWRGLRDEQTGWDISLDNLEAWLAALLEAADADQQAFDAWIEKCRQFAKNRQDASNLKNEYIKLFS
ncbi:MAG TPA: glycosyltransferase family 4 protein [Puia sp.]